MYRAHAKAYHTLAPTCRAHAPHPASLPLSCVPNPCTLVLHPCPAPGVPTTTLRTKHWYPSTAPMSRTRRPYHHPAYQTLVPLYRTHFCTSFRVLPMNFDKSFASNDCTGMAQCRKPFCFQCKFYFAIAFNKQFLGFQIISIWRYC